jgi:hypothetical protein
VWVSFFQRPTVSLEDRQQEILSSDKQETNKTKMINVPTEPNSQGTVFATSIYALKSGSTTYLRPNGTISTSSPNVLIKWKQEMERTTVRSR